MLTDMYSKHAQKRSFQRRISENDIAFVLRFGTKIHNGGALFVFLGQRNIPDKYKSDSRIRRLEGTILIMTPDESCLITVYKNKKGIREIKKKCKRYIKQRAEPQSGNKHSNNQDSPHNTGYKHPQKPTPTFVEADCTGQPAH